MRSASGVFPSEEQARRAVDQLQAVVRPGDISLLLPDTREDGTPRVPTTEEVPTTEDMPPVMKYLGGALGGALGAGLAASLIIPGIGAVTAAGAAAVALLGAMGAIAGGAAGAAVDDAAFEGIPVDELFVYEDALRRGRSVVIVLARDQATAELARSILSASGAESVDAARENWWVGLRSAEELEYQATGGDFRADEPLYRRGFEAALNPAFRGRNYQDALSELQRRYPTAYQEQAFRRGYERGLAYDPARRERAVAGR